MTAPRTFLDDPAMAKAFGLTPSANPNSASGHPEPVDIPSAEREMGQWIHRGGKLSPNDPIGGGTKYPGGAYGGEFSDEDWAAYKDAAKKLDAARGAAKLAPLLERLHSESRQSADATRQTGKKS